MVKVASPLISLILKSVQRGLKTNFLVVVALLLGAGLQVPAQPATDTTKKPKVPATIFRDSGGNLISNDEFVDIRMANFGEKDRTVVKTLDDGTIEFTLAKVTQEGTHAPDFSATTLDGRPVSLRSLRGKVVVLNFWFIACAYCRALQPKLNDFKAKFKGDDNVVFLAMTPDPVQELRQYLSKERFDFLHIAEADSLLSSFRFTGYPKNIVIGKTGEIVYWRSTVNAWNKFESVINRELAR